MAEDVSNDYYQGILVPDPRMRLSFFSQSLSSFSQADPLPGVPEAISPTALILEASGSQSAGKTLQVVTQKAGYAGVNQASFAWKYTTDATNKYRGWDRPLIVAGYDYAAWAAANGYGYPHAVALDSGRVLVAVHQFQGGNEILRVFRNDGGAWSSTTVLTLTTAPIHRFYPCLMVLPSGRIHLYAWVETGTTANIKCWYSDNDGTSWSVAQSEVLPEAVDISGVAGAGAAGYDLDRIRAAYNNGQVCLIVSLHAHNTNNLPTNPARSTFWQYASIDQGLAFSRIEAVTLADTSTHIGSGHDLVPLPLGGFGFIYTLYSNTPANLTLQYKTIPDAYTTLSSLTPAQIDSLTTGVNTTGKIEAEGTLVLADDSRLTVFSRTAPAVLQIVAFGLQSYDYGSSWSRASLSPGGTIPPAIYRGENNAPGALDTYPVDMAGCWHQGRVLLFHRHTNNAGTYDNSLGFFVCGGYTQVTQPSQYGWDYTFIPFDTRQNLNGYVVALVGAPVISQSATAEETWTTVAAESIQIDQPGISAGGIVALWQVRCAAGSVQLLVSDGNYEATITLTPTTLTVTDTASAAVLYTGAITGSSLQQLYIGVDAQKVGVWQRTSDSSPDRQWNQLLQNGALTLGASGNRLRQYQPASSTSHTRALFWFSGGGSFFDQDNPAELSYFRGYSTYPIYVNDGVLLRAFDGPTWHDDYFEVSTRYGYPIAHLHSDTNPSPQQEWRSTDLTQQSLVWEWDNTLTEDSLFMEPVTGLYLTGINFRYAELWGRDSAGAWIQIASIDATQGQNGLTYRRDGKVIRPSGSTVVATDYLMQNTLVGSYWIYDGATGNDIRPITQNSGGAWTTQTTKQSRLYIDPIEAGDPTSGSAGAILSKEVMTYIYTPTTLYSAYKLVIPAQNTYEGYFKIAKMVLGSVVVFGRNYSWGRGVQYAPNTSLETGINGARYSRNLGATRRTISFSWADGVDLTQASKPQPQPDYCLPFAGSLNPLATPADTPYQVAGLVEQLQGANTPIVYLAKIPQTTPTTGSDGLTQVQVNRQLFVYGRIASPVQIDTALGSEWGYPAGELVRVATVAIEEEL